MQTHVSQVPAQVQAIQKQTKALHAHENNKTTLIFRAIVLGTALTLFKFEKFFCCHIKQTSNSYIKSPQTISKPVNNFNSSRKQP